MGYAVPRNQAKIQRNNIPWYRPYFFVNPVHQNLLWQIHFDIWQN